MASDYRLTTSLPSLGAAPLPTSGIGEYLNQQVLGAQNRQTTEARRNAYNPAAIQTRETRTPTVEVGDSIDYGANVTSTAKKISDTNKRLFEATQQAKNVRNRQNVGSTGSGSGKWSNTYTVPAGVKGSRAQALQNAASYLGSRYVLGGRSKQGIDCSGLVMMAYNPLGFNVSRHSASWQRDNIPGVRTNDIGSLRPGDIVAWRDGSHIAVYAGNGEIIEAANERVGTVRRKIWASSSQLVGIKLRFPGE